MILAKEVKAESVAGTWGDATKKQFGYDQIQMKKTLSVTQENFGYTACKEEREKQENKYAKFVSQINKYA